MDFLRPTDWAGALAAKAAHPDAVPIAGGTDVMVELTFDRRRPDRLLDLSGIPELRRWETGERTVRLGAAVPYRAVLDHLAGPLPALALAARTVGSPQIRNRGSVGGNLGAASPAGDSHPALLAAGAEVEAASVRGTRRIPIDAFYTGVKRNALAPDELIRAIHIDRATGPQQFAKVGTRNAMVIAVCAFALALHPHTGTVRTGIGSAAPTPVRAPDAEDYLSGALAGAGLWEDPRPLPEAVRRRFAELAATACRPIDDVRGTARYRVHAVGVLARRTLDRTWDAYTKGLTPCA
ncbi:FAD binding domain-containing protein [Streptomyces carpaticus]|uniref:FAD binding domain-containing protein n=1 Tax=Streptomyces carpaticus TaxID=285558 RepID=UPI0022079EFA|nr:FAD binding domain-containing protein [Streptomyces carpaticus]